ncbi:MAG: dephospho-CoA kinase [Alphaproteobacteria bacterium]
MKIIGLTGSIAMGKSTAAKMLARMGYAHFDADAVVHALTGPHGRALPAIAAFAPEAVSTEAGMDRRRLGDLAFRDQSVLRKLEAVLHPMVYAENRRLLALWQRQRRRKVLLDVPLLLEGAGERRCDAVWVVSAPKALQAQRALSRPGMTPEKLRGILSRQVPDREKRRRADVVIATGLGRAITWAALAQADRLLVREHTWPPRHRRNALFRGRIHDARPPASKPKGGLK